LTRCATAALTTLVYNDLKSGVFRSSSSVSQRLAQLKQVERAVERQQEERIRNHLENVKQARLNELLGEGIITDDLHGEVRGLIDRELAQAPGEYSGSTK
jgi:hypothetical protein